MFCRDIFGSNDVKERETAEREVDSLFNSLLSNRQSSHLNHHTQVPLPLF